MSSAPARAALCWASVRRRSSPSTTPCLRRWPPARFCARPELAAQQALVQATLVELRRAPGSRWCPSAGTRLLDAGDRHPRRGGLRRRRERFDEQLQFSSGLGQGPTVPATFFGLRIHRHGASLVSMTAWRRLEQGRPMNRVKVEQGGPVSRGKKSAEDSGKILSAVGVRGARNRAWKCHSFATSFRLTFPPSVQTPILRRRGEDEQKQQHACGEERTWAERRPCVTVNPHGNANA